MFHQWSLLYFIRHTERNKLNQTLHLTKCSHFEKKKLENVKSNTHATWKILNEVLNRNKSRVNTVFRSDNMEVSDPTEVNNRKYRYFSSIGPKLTKK